MTDNFFECTKTFHRKIKRTTAISLREMKWNYCVFKKVKQVALKQQVFYLTKAEFEKTSFLSSFC